MSLLSGYDAVICDLDGVVHRGHRAVPGSPEALHRIVRGGRRVIYATNNASRPPSDVVAHLTGLGAPARVVDVVTSAQAGAVRVRELVPAGSPVVALGGAGVVAALAEQDLDPVSPDAPEAAAVLQGYGPALTVSDFLTATRHLLRGVPWVATNGDITLPVEWGVAPGNGAYVELLERAVRRRPDSVTGKPSPPLYNLALERLGRPRDRVLAVGDRLDTDIDGATNAGLHSAWVLSGVSQPSDLIELERPAPTYVLRSLADLEAPYVAPHRADDGWACLAYRAVVVKDPTGARLALSNAAGALEASGGGWPIEAVRAGLAALLEARAKHDITPEALLAAARHLDAPER